MNNDKLSKRLQKVADFVDDGARLADIGSDHAYLPVNLIKAGKISYAVAGEVVEGPYQSAKTNVAYEGLTSNINVRLANGLSAVLEEDNIDTVVIAGMGGNLIASILEQGLSKLGKGIKLILQPNNGEYRLRQWLVKENYKIVSELILEENDKIYEIIVAEVVAEVSLSPEELRFGPILISEKNPVFRKKWLAELRQKEKILENLLSKNLAPDKQDKLKAEILQIREVLEDEG